MSYQVLARKWRPTSFAQMVGQEHIVQALVNALDGERLHHAYLFSGTRGVGKTTVARILAKALNCERGIGSNPCGDCASCAEIDQGRSVDLIEVDAASRTGVDDMRELLENVQYAPTRGRFKVYLVDEVHMLSRHSFNALLKTLEEPPAHIKFLFATTDPQKIPVTVLSRCLQFNLKRMSREQIRGQLEFLSQQEDIEADAEALLQLAGAADGSMRDALSLLDQAIGYGAGTVRGQAVEAMLGSISTDYLIRIFDALSAQDAGEMLRAARTVVEFSPDYQRVCADMINLLQQLALFQQSPDLVNAHTIGETVLQKYAACWSAEEIQLFYQILLQGRQDLLICPDGAGGFEMLMLRLLAFAPLEQPADVVKKKPDLTPVAIEAVVSTAVDQTRAAPTLDWQNLAFTLELDGLARQIVANSRLRSYRDDRLELTLQNELFELVNGDIQTQIKQALELKLGVLLQLDLYRGDDAAEPTPQQALQARQQQERAAVIEAIRRDQTVTKLARAVAAELDESSVVKIEDNVY